MLRGYSFGFHIDGLHKFSTFGQSNCGGDINGDGINDQFIILKINNYSNNMLSIYTRSGVLVYSKRNYQNNWPADAGGKEFPEGSYFFRLDLEQDGKIDNQGWLYLSR